MKQNLTERIEHNKTLKQQGSDIANKVLTSKIGQKVHLPLLTTAVLVGTIIESGGGRRRWWV